MRRKTARSTEPVRPPTGQPLPAAGIQQATPTLPDAPDNCHIKLYPDLALGILRQEQTAAGRVWLLLRYLDEAGRGWLSVEHARACLTDKESGLRVCGWRQLRNLLRQGDGIFWVRDKERIWIRSVARTAAALDVWKLTGRPVGVPLKDLLKGIGTVRAHLYASFHSGRVTKGRSGARQAMPISRETIQHLCGLSRRTQRNYERSVRVRRERNFAVGAQTKTSDPREAAWQHGRAFFHLIDKNGKQGVPGKTYQAWQLPNNYFGPHAQQSRGRQKRINQQLADLFMKGMTGNGEEMVTAGNPPCAKRFYGNARQAAKAYGRPAQQDIYWVSPDAFSSRVPARVWHVLPAKSGSC